jgi:thiol:disulfide interchange protein DsbD
MRRRLTSWTISMLVGLLLPMAVRAEGKVVSLSLFPSLSGFQPGSATRVAARVEIEPGWHINAHRPSEAFLMPTELVFVPVEGVSFGEVQFPPAETKSFSFWPKPLTVYEGSLLLFAEVRLAESFRGDSLRLRAALRYQACNDSLCSPPDTVFACLTIPVVSLATPVHPVNDSLFGQLPALGQQEAHAGGEVAQLVARRGMFFALLFVFLGGLALNLTPCVYPLIPITVSYFGAQQNPSLAQAFGKSLAYVVGIAVMYSVLGVVASLTGGLFGASLQNPWVLAFVAAVFVALALSFFGLYEFHLPSWLLGAASTGKGGYFGAFLMGLTVGIVAAPCIGPFVLALLTYVAATGSPFIGFWMFCVFALGLGLPYLILGTFSGSLARLPQSGAWMTWVRKIFGFVLIGMAVYFLRPVLPEGVHRALLIGTAIVGGVFLGWLEKSQAPGWGYRVARWAVGVGGIAIGVWLGLAGGITHGGIRWQPYDPGALQSARASGKPVILDFSAEWCVACRELDSKTFSDPRVVARASEFLTFRADLTRYSSSPATALRQRYGIVGLPTVVFLMPDGVEMADLRVVGFLPADEFLARMDKALGRVRGTDSSQR